MHNILFVITKSEVGGAQKFVKEQIDITAEMFNVYLCTNKDGWLIEASSAKLKGKLLDERIEKLTSLVFLFKLFRFIKVNKIDLVVTNSANGGFYGRVAAFFTRVPSCYLSHGWSSVYNGGRLSCILNFIEKILAKISQKVICVSDNDYRVAVNKIGISPEKLSVVKNAILPMGNNGNITQQNAYNKPFTVIALARFAKPKRIDLMIEAFKLLPQINLHIAGSGSDFQYWQDYITNNAIKNVTLLGELPSFNKFQNYNTFLLISNSEGLPISAIEAMSVGLPLILSNVGGCSELILNNGFLVDNNINAIVEALKQVITVEEIFSRNSLSLFNTYFNLNNVKNSYLKLYTELIIK